MTVTATPVHAAPVDLTFLNINDFHGRINANTTKFATTIEQQRVLAGEANTLLLGAGDLIGASEFASSSAQDQPTIDVMNALDLASSAVGNHEFDKGFTDLKDRVINGPTPAQWSYLGANVYAKGTTTPVLDEYDIFTVNGITVGVIGAVTEETPSLVTPAGITTLDFGDPVEAVNRVADQLTDGNAANGEAQVIIAEYHEGAPEGAALSTLELQIAASAAFADIVNVTSAKVDAIFTGHTHKLYAWDAPIPGGGGTRPIVQTGSYGENLGKIVLTYEPTTDDVTAYVATNIARVGAEDASLPRVADVKTIVNAAIAASNVVGAVPIGSVTADITTAWKSGGYTGPNGTFVSAAVPADRDDRTKESSLGNLVADALLDTLAPAQYGAAEIGVANSGGLRNELFYAPDGVITYAEANGVLPFLNNLWTTTLTGAQFKTLLEQQWQRTAVGVSLGTFLQLGLSDNVTYTFDASQPIDQRITSISIDGVPVNPAGTYRIGTFSFLATGGDNFHVFKSATNSKDSGLIDRDGWISYLTDNAPVSPEFARQAVAATALPTTAAAGTNVAFGLSGLDLTSLGSPQNTSVEVYLGGVSLGVVPVTNGAVAISLAVPNTVPSGLQPLQVVASPTNTTVTIPVTVTSTTAAKPYKPLIFAQGPIVKVAPQRLVDTREGLGFAKAKLTAFTEYKLVVAGKYGVAANAKAVAVNLTTTNSGLPGFVNAYPCGGTVNPLASAVNQFPDRIVANLAVVDIGAGGAICFVSNDPTDLVVDLQTWYPSDSDLETMTPVRIVDTRSALGLPTKLASNTPVELQVTGKNGVPANASAVVVNLTMTESNAGFFTAYPCGTTPPVASNLNAWPGKAIANLAVVGVGTGGKICFLASDTTHLVVDLQGFYGVGADYNAMTPVRALDTRTPSNPLVSNVFREIKIAGLYGVPSQADLVAVNVTAVDATGPAFITVYPCGNLPVVSAGNTSPDRIVATLALVNLSANGSICVLSNLKTDLAVDIQGWQG